MNCTDRDFAKLVDDIKSVSEEDLFGRMAAGFDSLPLDIRRGLQIYFDKFGFWGRLDPEHGIYDEIKAKARELSEHIDDFARVYDLLADYRSKKTLFAVLNNWYAYDFKTVARVKEQLFDEYFDHDLLHCGENEVFVDLGAYYGETTLSFIYNYGNCHKKIYCYEITPDVFAQLQKNLSAVRRADLRLKGVGASAGRMTVSRNVFSSSANTLTESGEGTYVEVVTLDEDIQEPVTIIKADIEGSEQDALAGAVNHIVNERPRLLISVYHCNEDMWKIPEIIRGMRDDYKFYLRFKGSSFLYPTELTLFAL